VGQHTCAYGVYARVSHLPTPLPASSWAPAKTPPSSWSFPQPVLYQEKNRYFVLVMKYPRRQLCTRPCNTHPAVNYKHINTHTHANSFVLGPAVINTHTNRLVYTGSSSLVAHVPPISPPPPLKQHCTRSCSNKHTVLISNKNNNPGTHPGVLGSIPKREEPGKTGRHPVLKYRVPHRSQCVMGRLVHTGLGS
jgi:hypothetical protein